MAHFFAEVYDWANAIAAWSLGLDVLIFLPLSLIRPFRGFTGTMLVISSYTFGFVCWMWSAAVVYRLWGTAWMIAGLIFLGLGVVPMAFLALLFKGWWPQLGGLIGMIATVFITRILGMWVFTKRSGAPEAGELPELTDEQRRLIGMSPVDED